MAVEAGHETAAILAFLDRIGIPVRREPIAGKTFLPGIRIDRGALIVDEARLLYPGDLLHEAGHLAVMSPDQRVLCDGDAGESGGAEVAAIGWSYAAALEIGLNPRLVFHADGYKSGGDSLLQNFAEGRYLGAPLLQYYGLTKQPPSRGEPVPGEVTYPRMAHWLRSSP
jgi:hypothetical protein